MTEREELAKIVMKWLKTAKPDNAEAPSDLIDNVMEWHKKEIDEAYERGRNHDRVCRK